MHQKELTAAPRIHSNMHYLDVYSEICLMATNAYNLVRVHRLDFAHISIMQKETDKFHLRLIELHDAGKITGLIATQYIVELQQHIDKLTKFLIKLIQN